jgi:hypothetical protein
MIGKAEGMDLSLRVSLVEKIDRLILIFGGRSVISKKTFERENEKAVSLQTRS